ncbi:unnamed protein product [Musa hybrid cultivar]
MAKLQLLPVVAALCFAIAGVALATPNFRIQGRVYCDKCRAGFETSATDYIEGAKVKLECRQYDTGVVEQTATAVTDASGTYTLEVEDNHEEEICEVVLVESPRPGCSEIMTGRNRARVLISAESGLTTSVRYANSLGFLNAAPLPECGLLLQKYALGVDG